MKTTKRSPFAVQGYDLHECVCSWEEMLDLAQTWKGEPQSAYTPKLGFRRT